MRDSSQTKKYHQIKNRLFIVNWAFYLIILLAMIYSGFSARLKDILQVFSRSELILNGLYISCLCAVFYLLSLPLDFFEGFILEHKFNLSNESLSGYFKDNLKKAAVSLVIAIIAVEFLYLFLSGFPSLWWVFAAGGWFFLTVILAKITPDFLIPLFYKYIPLKDEELRSKIKKMFAGAHTPLKDVYVINFSAKTKKLNAAVAGFGRGRRVILTDNLLSRLSHEEILSIVAHELGHYKNRDTIKIIIFGALGAAGLFFLSDIILRGSFPRFGYSSMSDIAGFPLLSLIMFILGILGLPLQNAFIRGLENKADKYSLFITRAPDVFISMMQKLADSNLAQMFPGKFIEAMLYDHPPVGKRIELARAYKKQMKES